MNHKPPIISDNELDDLLSHSDFLQPPDDFEQKVMQSINQQPQHDAVSVSGWQWVVLLASAISGLPQLLVFIFSVWTTVSAG